MTEATVRGLNHVGITVSDIEVATDFFVRALGAQVIYEAFSRSNPEVSGSDFEASYGLGDGAVMTTIRLLQVESGPDLELLEMRAPAQARPALGSDLGVTHLAFYADDIEAAANRFAAAGGRLLLPPTLIGEAGSPGQNLHCYAQTPWGMAIEFIQLDGELSHEAKTDLRRWHRQG